MILALKREFSEPQMLAKKILFSMVATSLILTGCGGGGSDSDDDYSSVSKDSLVNGTRYYYMNYSTSKNSDDFTASYEEVQNKQFKDPSSSHKALGYYLLTNSKLYTPNDIAERTIDLDDLTRWTVNTIGNVKSDWRFEKVNLSGRNMFDTVLPGYRQVGFDDQNTYGYARIFLSAYGKEKFPNGSSCYRLVSQKDRVDSISFDVDADYEIKQSFEDFDDENIDYIDDLNAANNGLQYRYASGIWQAIPWTTIYDLDFVLNAKDATAVEFQNKLYEAEFTPSLEKTAAQEYKTLGKLLNSAKGDREKRTFQLQMAQNQSGCYIYNETAAKSLLEFRLLRWTN